ncbi:MAG TPA: radical SAM protein [Solirubrobacterales bacterium]|nr:radical SAM protein [Solirubrobacterales bacterium]
MRWDQLRVERDARLPGIGDGAVVRTFDAPEATGIRFHEVRAKSVLNRVPSGRFGFDWTVNAFRGCSHACVYCLAPETPVLMADGRASPIAEVRAGDEVYGTARLGSYRRYGTTRILAHWETKKQAYRLTLEDGTELIASGDHRFLSDRGWKFVTGAEHGRGRRPHLTTNNKLMGFGGISRPPGASIEYRRGYLCGMVRGDGHLGSYSYARAGRSNGDVHRFRLALADSEALERAAAYLSGLGVATSEFLFHGATGTQRKIRAIRASTREGVERVRELIEWPRAPSSDWAKGFLAGIFDAEGSCNGALRISNKDVSIIGHVSEAIRDLGFRSTVEPASPNGVRTVRLLGGLARQQRFFETVDPVITRKRALKGTAIEGDAPLGVVAIEPLGKRVPMFDITTGTGDFIANGVVSHNCFARRTHPFLGFDAGRDFEKEIVVKVNTPEVLRAELARPSWQRQLVALGTNTDPYQWAESRYRFMPEIIEALEAASTPISVLTKSPLALRDIDLYERAARKVDVSVNLSVPTLDEKAWRATEPHTPHPRARLEAVAKLKERGIGSGVLIAPLMPGINDSPEQVEPIVELAREAGADFLGGVALHLRDEVRDVFFGWLRAKRPDLVPRYEELYANGRGYMRPDQRRDVSSAVTGWGRNRRRSPPDRGAQSPLDGGRRVKSPPPPGQPSLF